MRVEAAPGPARAESQSPKSATRPFRDLMRLRCAWPWPTEAFPVPSVAQPAQEMRLPGMQLSLQSSALVQRPVFVLHEHAGVMSQVLSREADGLTKQRATAKQEPVRKHSRSLQGRWARHRAAGGTSRPQPKRLQLPVESQSTSDASTPLSSAVSSAGPARSGVPAPGAANFLQVPPARPARSADEAFPRSVARFELRFGDFHASPFASPSSFPDLVIPEPLFQPLPGPEQQGANTGLGTLHHAGDLHRT